MKYNLTNETYLPETLSNFPGAPSLSFWDMISGAVFYNWLSLIISLTLYIPIVFGIKKLIAQIELQLILTGIALTLTTPILFMFLNDWEHNDYYQVKAEMIAWTLCFIASVGFYYTVNRQGDNDKLVNVN